MELNVNFRVLKVNNHRIQNSVCQDEKPGRGKVCPNEEPKGLQGQGKSVFNTGCIGRVPCFTAFRVRVSTECWHAYAIDVILEKSREHVF